MHHYPLTTGDDRRALYNGSSATLLCIIFDVLGCGTEVTPTSAAAAERRFFTFCTRFLTCDERERSVKACLLLKPTEPSSNSHPLLLQRLHACARVTWWQHEPCVTRHFGDHHAKSASCCKPHLLYILWCPPQQRWLRLSSQRTMPLALLVTPIQCKSQYDTEAIALLREAKAASREVQVCGDRLR